MKLQELSVEPWHSRLAPNNPRVDRRGDTLLTAALATPVCAGGWQMTYGGVTPGDSYRITARVIHEGIGVPRDVIQCEAIWGKIDAAEAVKNPGAAWNHLIPSYENQFVTFSRIVAAPPGSEFLTIRYSFKWAERGSAEWSLPVIETATPSAERKARLCAVTGSEARITGATVRNTMDSAEFYAALCREACAAVKPDLIVLPEVALQWLLKSDHKSHALCIPSPEIDLIRGVARESAANIVLGTHLLDEHGHIRNSTVMIGEDGRVRGCYYKMHLALGENESGTLPGDEMPVWNTSAGRIACNICMDSSALESSRLAALGGADILALSIMGDFRASRWSMGMPRFDDDRFRAIMRVRAMDSALFFVVARNRVKGSCVVDPTGEVLTWNDGAADFAHADVNLDFNPRAWNGCFARDALYLQRRPHLYGAFCDTANYGQCLGIDQGQ